MASKVVNLLTREQLDYLKELNCMLTSVHTDKSRLYPMATIDENGRHEHLVSREEYLEFIIGVVVEGLGETFPHLEEFN